VKVGDLVRMDFEDWPNQDEWGIGIIVTDEDRDPDDVEVFWSKIGLGWEMKMMLEVICEGR